MKSSFQFNCLLVVITIGCSSAAAVGKLPKTFDLCPKGPEFDSCAGKAVEKALSVLVDGYAPLGIHSIDPLEIIAIDIDQGSGPVSINLKFKNLKISGLKNTKVSNFKSDLNKLQFAGSVEIPKILLDGFYAVDGKVLILPIKGDGKSKLSLDDVTADFALTGKHFVKDGVTYMKVTRFDMKIDTKKLGISLTNLFNGDKALGDNMNKFLNENWADILKELRPAVQETFGAAFAEISNRIFTKVPFDDIFAK